MTEDDELAGVELFPIPGYEDNYSISKDARVWAHRIPLRGNSFGNRQRYRKPKWVKSRVDCMGYLAVSLYNQKTNNTRQQRVHVLLARAFLGAGLANQIRHKNGDSLDNRLDNLQVVEKLSSNDRTKKYRKERIAKGGCAYCSGTAMQGKTICKKCRNKRRKITKRKKKEGICYQSGCWNPAMPGLRDCYKHRHARLEKQRDLKQQVLDHYGQKCNCTCGCGVTRFEHLTVDHINNDGARHRKSSKSGGGHAFYRTIIKENFPDDLQILCWNCNCAKQFYGGCDSTGSLQRVTIPEQLSLLDPEPASPGFSRS